MLEEPSEEIRLAERITNLLHEIPIDNVDKILEMVRNKVIAVKIGHSIIFYYYFKTLKSWQDMKNSIKAGTLKRDIEELCRLADSQTNVVIAKIYIKDDDLENIERHFACKG